MTVIWGADGTLQNLGAPDWLTNAELQHLMAAFEDAGFCIYAVGGCVRDSVLDGFTVKDVDLSTNARPNQTIKIIESLTFEGQPWKAVPTGIDHGTVTAGSPYDGIPYEITTFRKDVETDGRHATVSFSDTMEEDSIRRDFTINAIYADRAGQVTDVVGGSTDLQAQRIRFIGDPMARIEEDYLRILRFFRFHATHGRPEDGIEADGLAACASLAEGLERVSRERIGAEVLKIMQVADPAPVIGSMEQSGVLMRILPGASVQVLARLIHLEGLAAGDGALDVATRLAALGADQVVDKLRLSKDMARKIDLVTAEAGKTTPAHEMGFRYGEWPAIHGLLLRWASLGSHYDADAIADVRRGAGATFPVTASDLMPELSGKALGDRLKSLEAAWIASDFTLTRDALLEHP